MKDRSMSIGKRLLQIIPFVFFIFLPHFSSAAVTFETVDTTTNPIVISGTSTESGATITSVEYQVNGTAGAWTSCAATSGTFNSSVETFSCSLGSLTDGSYTVYIRTTVDRPIPFQSTSTDPSTGNDDGYDITSDTSNIYFTGSCDGCGVTGGRSIYTVATSKTDGSQVWATATDPTSGSDNGSGIASDANNIYVTGVCTGCGSKGGFAYYTFALLKTDGSFVWASSTDRVAGTDTADDITVDDTNVYVTGYCSGCGSLGGYALNTVVYDKSDGSLVWSTTTDMTTGFDSASGITVDDSNVYISGDCAGCGPLGGGAYYVMARSKTDGSLVWATTTDPTSGSDNSSDISSDSTNLYVTGTCDGCGSQGGYALYTVALSKTNGALVWDAITDPTVDFDYAYGIDVDSDRVYVTGYCDACDTNGSDAYYTAAYDISDGTLLWSTSTDPSSSYDNGWGVTHDNEYVYVHGYCNGCSTGGTMYTIVYNKETGETNIASSSVSNAVFSVSVPEQQSSGGGSSGGTRASVSSLEVTVESGTTTESVQTEIQSLLAQIDALVELAESLGYDVNVGKTRYVFTVDLELGSTHEDVVYLQKYLETKGYLTMPTAVDYGYFGPLTKTAVIALQDANSIDPSVGYFGPVTRAFVNEH